MQVRRTYEYRMYNSKQNKHLDDVLLVAAEIWNYCIAVHRRYYRMYGKHLSANKLKVHITKLKKLPKYTHWNTLGSQAIQDIPERINRSYQAFFSHVKKKKPGRKSPPKFRKASRYRSFTLKQAGYKFLEGNRIEIMGRTYKYVNHRPLQGNIKTVTVKRNLQGEYSLFVSVIEEWPDIQPRTGKSVGLDFGLKHFLTMDNGNHVDSPLWFKQAEQDLRKAHRRLSRCERGSNNRKRALADLERLYERISSRRRNWFFKLANALTKEYAAICIEDLNIDAMKRLWGKKVSDLAFSEFVEILHWVALKNGSRIIEIDRWYPSSKTCAKCGFVNENLFLKDRHWVCPSCGAQHDRDINAAVNIHNTGLGISAT